MLPKLQEWVEDQYFDGLVRDASKRALGDIFSAATTEWKARVHNFPLINAIHLFCKLSRKITDKRLDERELTDSLEDWAKLLVSIAHFVGTDEHTLRRDAVYRFERATSLVHSRCQPVAAGGPSPAH